MTRGRVDAQQLFWLSLVSMVATLVLTVPGELVRWAGRAAWWTPLAAAVVLVPLAFAVGRAAGRHGDAVALARDRLGPVAGRLLLLAIWAALALDAAMVTREVADGAASVFVRAVVPLPLLIVTVVGPGVWLAWLGPVVMGRVATVVTVGFVVLFVLGFAVATPALHVLWTRPILPVDGRFLSPPPLVLVGLWLIEPTLTVALMMGQARASARARGGTVAALATAAGAFLLTASIWLVIADFGPVRAAELAQPLLHVMQELPYTLYLEHLDSFVVPVEVLSALVKVGVFLWLWARISVGVLDLPTVWLLPALGLANGGLAMAIATNGLELDRLLYQATVYIVPAVLLLFAVAYVARGRRRGRVVRAT